jgi:hypothetical protein
VPPERRRALAQPNRRVGYALTHLPPENPENWQQPPPQ